MEPGRLLFSITASLAMLMGSHAAGAATITYVWLGAEVSITTPDDAAYGQPFDISLSIDTAVMPPGSTLAFTTFLDASDTIDITNAVWDYAFISDEPVWNFTTSGVLGDATTPTTQDAGGYSTRLFDPVNGNYTWLWSDYNDRVVWTLQDLVLLGDTSFTLTLEYFLSTPDSFVFEVLPSASAPEPSSAALLGLGLCFLAAARRRSARRGHSTARVSAGRA